MNVARAGRKPGTSDSRERILDAARERFTADGYDGASVRGIAATAGVDPGLVRHYFGSKEHLFVEAMRFPIDPAEFVPRLLAPGVDGLGERLARLFLEVWDAPSAPFVAMLRSVTTNGDAAEMIRQFVSREVIGRVAAQLELDNPRQRTALVGSQLIGLAFMRYVVKLEPIASMDREQLARLVAPTIQRYLTGGSDDP
jgi:AcrR family transcriptional regulator